MDDYLRDFVQETEDSITDLNNALLDLENDPGDEAAMDRIFRTAHTIKGNCGAMGFTKAADLAHAIEDLLDEMRAGRIAVTPETMDEVFDGVDTLEAMVEEVREHEEPSTDPSEVIDRLRGVIDEAPGPDVRIEEPDETQIETALEQVDGPAEPEQLVYHVRLAVTEQDVDEGMLVLEALADAFDVLTTNPPQNVIRNEDYGGSFDAVISSAIGSSDIRAALEAVDQVDDVIVTDVSDRVDEVSDDVEPIEVEDMEVEELLESVSEFDDIDAMADEIAEEEAMDELGDAGTFEELEVDDDDDIEIAGLLEDEELADDSEIEESDLGEMEDLEPDQPQDANEVFQELQAEVEEVDYEELEPELEALEFDEYADEEELSFDELMAEADEEPGPEDEDLAAFDSEFDEDEGVEEFDELFDEEGGEVADDELDEVLAEAEETTSGGDEVSFDELVEAVDEPAETGDAAEASAEDVLSDVDDAFGSDAETDLDAEPGVEAGAEPAEPEPDPSEPEPAETDEEPTEDADDVSGRDLAEIESIRVDVSQVDSLLNQVEQLVTNRLRLRRAIQEGDLDQAIDELDELETLTMRMQDTVMDVRLVPLSQVVGNLPRVVRDLARDQGKEVDFAVEGGDVELDRRILSELGDPLLHLVRNAVDHGIESPEAREAAGKDPEGELRIRARRTRDRVTIEVSDDGRGLDTEAIAEQAIEEDLITREEIDEMEDDQIRELIFEPGFSTAAEVTGVSGRGVGMDVVRETVQSLDGAVAVSSTPGKGTTITLRVPVSVAIVRVLFVESGGEEYGIPVKNVDEISQAAAVESVDGEEVLTHGDSVYPIVDLTEALETPGPSANGDGMLVRVNDEVRQVALHCDRVLRQEEVVVKPFEGLLSGIPGLSGAAVLGEGDVVTILDVETL
ncbi:chemotaxis protein CheA [Halobacteriales archaeon QS_1_68_20]|nr:MAG: chemotaxis protein CheA [Halobacteriales archaeon QS_1_68_20]